MCCVITVVVVFSPEFYYNCSQFCTGGLGEGDHSPFAHTRLDLPPGYGWEV